MEENSIDAVVCDPPYELSSGKPLVGYKNCLRWVLLNVSFPDLHEPDTKSLEAFDLASVLSEAPLLSSVGSTVGVRARVNVPVSAVNFKNGIEGGEEEIAHKGEAPELVTEGELPNVVESERIQLHGDYILQLRGPSHLSFCEGTCSCFRQLGTGRIGVPVVIPSAARGDGLDGVELPSLVSLRADSVGLSDDSLGVTKRTSGVVTGGGTEVTAMLTLDVRGRTAELTPTSGTDEAHFLLTMCEAESVGAGAGAGGLPTVLETSEAGSVDDAADGTNPLLGRILIHREFSAYLKGIVRQKGFMGKDWDGSGIAFSVDLWREAYRVLKPGGHLLSFGGTRRYHRMVSAIEDAGFEIRDCIQWIMGSGFPKSLNVGKTIDKMAGAEREVVGSKVGQPGYSLVDNSKDERNAYGRFVDAEAECAVTAPATEAAKQWEGWGTALKPAHEPIVLARKPLSESSVARQVLATSTGALNIDGCRVQSAAPHGQDGRQTFDGFSQNREVYGDGLNQQKSPKNESGRWPSNLLLSHTSLPVYRLAGKIPLDIQRYIEGYFHGYIRVQALRQTKGTPAVRGTTEDVLQSGVLKRSAQRETQERMGRDIVLELRRDVSGNPSLGEEWPQEVLQQGLPKPLPNETERRRRPEIREASISGEQAQDIRVTQEETPRANGGESPGLERRDVSPGGLPECVGSHPDGGRQDSSRTNAGQVGLRQGAPVDNGAALGETAHEGRNRTSQERRQAGQPTRESGLNGTEAPLSDTPANGQAHSAVRSGERSLEVLACDIPESFLAYFAPTGEDLGCEATGGVRRVKGTNRPGQEPFNSHEIYGAHVAENGNHPSTYTNPDGTEEVAEYRCVEGCPVRLMDEQSGQSKSPDKPVTQGKRATGSGWDRPVNNRHTAKGVGFGDAGGASRFFKTFDGGYGARDGDNVSPEASTADYSDGLQDGQELSRLRQPVSPAKQLAGFTLEPGFKYVAKSSRRERNVGLESSHEVATPHGTRLRDIEDADWSKRNGNHHPTVKPIALMRYLCKLITPPGGTVLDPFAGSGSTGCAAVQEGFNFVGIEKESEYAEIARRRIAYWSQAEEPKKNGKPKPDSKRLEPMETLFP
jgi:hypothetical protein